MPYFIPGPTEPAPVIKEETPEDIQIQMAGPIQMPDHKPLWINPTLLPWNGDPYLNAVAFPEQSVFNRRLVHWMGVARWSRVITPYVSGKVDALLMNERIQEIATLYKRWLAYADRVKQTFLASPCFNSQ
jgi:hypothetical protein